MMISSHTLDIQKRSNFAINHKKTARGSDATLHIIVNSVTNLLFSVLLLALRPFFIAEEKFDSDNFYISFFFRFLSKKQSSLTFWWHSSIGTLAKSLHCQLGNLRSHVSSSHIVPVTQSKHKSLVPHSLIIQTRSLLVSRVPISIRHLDLSE